LIVGSGCPVVADHFELQSDFIVFPVHESIGFFVRQTVG
jgi:hypothetical protein